MVRLRHYLKGAAWLAVAILVIAQAFRIDRTNPPVVQDIGAPPEVDGLLRRACYDCHSNEPSGPGTARSRPSHGSSRVTSAKGVASSTSPPGTPTTPRRRTRRSKSRSKRPSRGKCRPGSTSRCMAMRRCQPPTSNAYGTGRRPNGQSSSADAEALHRLLGLPSAHVRRARSGTNVPSAIRVGTS